MIKIVTIFCILITFNKVSLAQQAIYFELGGPGLASFNFDSRFSGKHDGIGGRVGIGGFSVKNETALYYPLQINYLLGKDKKNYFEIGTGLTIVSYKKDTYNNEVHNGPFQQNFGHIYFGYRRQPANGGFLFRGGISPIFSVTSKNSFFIPYYAGVSFGYAF